MAPQRYIVVGLFLSHFLVAPANAEYGDRDQLGTHGTGSTSTAGADSNDKRYSFTWNPFTQKWDPAPGYADFHLPSWSWAFITGNNSTGSLRAGSGPCDCSVGPGGLLGHI